MRRTLSFQALDGARVSFRVPKHVNGYLAERALKAIHEGGDEAAAMFHLTREESEFVARMVAELERHRPRGEAA